MPRQPFSTSRLDRASRFLVESAPDLAFADSLAQSGSQGLRDQLAVESFNAQQQQNSLVNARIARQQELENARAAAKDALEDQAQKDELAALNFLTNVRTDKPGAEVEPDLVLAKFPGALRSPVIRDIYARKMQAIGQMKTTAEKYLEVTGGEPFPLNKDGLYDVQTGETRIYKNLQINNALASRMITPEEAEAWRGTPESVFRSAWDSHLANRSFEAKDFEAKRAFQKSQIDQTQDQLKTNLDLAKVAAPKPEDALTMDPNALAAQKKVSDQFLSRAVELGNQVNTLARPVSAPKAPVDPEEQVKADVARVQEFRAKIQGGKTQN